MSKRLMLDMKAEAVIPAWTNSSPAEYNGSELQRMILRGFAEPKCTTFAKVFTFKEHGEFFRGGLTMASLRYTNDFYELLKRYETIKVTIVKEEREER